MHLVEVLLLPLRRSGEGAATQRADLVGLQSPAPQQRNFGLEQEAGEAVGLGAVGHDDRGAGYQGQDFQQRLKAGLDLVGSELAVRLARRVPGVDGRRPSFHWMPSMRVAASSSPGMMKPVGDAVPMLE